MKPWFLTVFSIALTFTATAQAVPVHSGPEQLKRYHTGNAAALADSETLPPAVLVSEHNQPAPDGYQVKMPIGQAKITAPAGKFIQQIDSRTKLQCREQNNQLDQCMVLPIFQTKELQTNQLQINTAIATTAAANQIAVADLVLPAAADRIAVADLVLPDAQLKACIVQAAQQYNVNFADEIQWLSCYHNYQQPAIRDLSGLSQLSNLRSFYVGADNAASSTLTGLDELLQLSKLNALTIERYRLSSIDFLTEMPLIRNLGLHRVKVDAGWGVLPQLDQILSFSHSTDADSDTPDIVPLINQMAGLTYIFVNSAKHQNLAGLSHPGITNVFVYQVTDLNFVTGVPALAYLDVYQNMLSDLNMSAIQNNQNVLSLSLNSVQLDDADIQVIQSLTKLSHLTILENPNLTSLAFISQLNSLQSLSLLHTVNDANFASFTLPDQLMHLNLSRSEWQQKDGTILKSINKLIQNPKKLTNLNLTGQKYLPCAEIAQISAKITSVVAPASCGSTTTKLSEVSIPDPALYQCIANQNREYLEDITNLNCGYARTLTGLQHLKNLNALYLYGDGNEQTLTGDITPIEQLTKLQSLSLTNQKLTDSKIALQYPASLTSLDLAMNQLTQASVNSLQTVLPQLNQLTLNNNSFSSFSWLANSTNLRFLTIGANPVTDLTFISQLPQLSYLSIQSLQLKDLSAFSMPAGINNLDVSRNQLTSLAAVTDRLANPHLLTSLSAGDMSLTDLSQLKLLPNLSYLSLYGNKVATNYTDIGTLQKLNWLNLQEAVLPLKFPDFVVPASLKYLYMTSYNVNKARVQDISEIVRAASQFSNVQLNGQVTIDCTQVNTLKNHANSNAFMLPAQCGQLMVNETTLPDPVLRQCLLNSGQTVMLNITSIFCNGNVTNWAGVKHMTNLSRVNATGTETAAKTILGLEEFAGLTKLSSLRLMGQGLNDASWANMNSNTISLLYLNKNPITQAIFNHFDGKFPALQSVDFRQTNITDLQNIAKVNAPSIDLNGSLQISNYAGLNQLGSKTHTLSLGVDNSTALQGLKIPPQVTTIWLGGAAFVNIKQALTFFQQPATLTSLGFRGSSNATPSQLTSLEGLNQLPNLTSFFLLDQGSESLTDFTPITQLTKLTHLAVNSRKLTSLEPLKPLLGQLLWLDIDRSSVSDLSPLTALTKATDLYISDLPAQNYSPLHKLSALRSIGLYNSNSIYCTELDLLKQNLPAAFISMPRLCTDAVTKSFQTLDGKAINSVGFSNAADSKFGALTIVNGQIVYQPANNVSGWIEFSITYIVNGSTLSTTIRTWVEPPAVKPRRGLPWWVLTAAQATTPEKMTDAMVGNWHFGCDGQGRSRVYEIIKAGPTRIHFNRSVTREYSNNNCSGTFTQTSDTHDTIQDFSNIVAVTPVADGQVRISASGVLEDGVTPVSLVIIISANRDTLKVEGDNSWNFIRRVNSFAFPS